MKRLTFIVFLSLSAIFISTVALATTVDVLIKGVDNGIKTTKQRDYKEAVMNAKKQAIERAGVDIKSITQVENGRLKYDMIESMAKAVLLSGFQVMDLGYQRDGTYRLFFPGRCGLGRRNQQGNRNPKCMHEIVSQSFMKMVL